jgi:predicted Zn-dependent peptidase
MYPKKFFFFFLLLGLLVALNANSWAQFDEMKAQVKEHTLANGMKWIVLERHEAPVVSFHVYADVGSANESYGITGISHILEHMAFKGSKTIGTKDYQAELLLFAKQDSLFDVINREQNKAKPDTALISKLKTSFEDYQTKAKQLVVSNEFIDMFRQEGEPGVNAYTSFDATQYINALPANKIEFWMAMTSDRFMNPVFRELYKEKDVVMEERRLRIETQPIYKLFVEDFVATAYKAHPYHHNVIGHMSDLERITRKDVQDYFQKYYGPSNLTVALVGDINANDVFKMAELYFGRIPTAPKPEPVRTVEPEQWGERHVNVEAQSQPLILIGYHRPSINHPDNDALDALADIIGQGRSSRLYQGLVKENKIAIQTGCFNGYPGTKYPSLVAFYAFASKDHTSAENLALIDKEIAKIKNESVTEEELTKFKRSSKKNILDQMKDNGQMAALLTAADVVMGDWRQVFDAIKKIDKITADDVKRVANTYLTNKNRTVGEIVPEQKAN